MSTHEAIAALPTGGNANPALIRALLTRRLAYSLASGEDASTLDVVDPDTSVVPLYLIQNGTLFEYDALDTTTAAGATCLVTHDSKRYKTSAVEFPYSVLSTSTSAQPVSPSIGDRYLIPTAATGTDWSGKDGKIGIFGPRGWEFAAAAIGQRLYVEGTDTFYYKNASGVWTAGFGAVSIGANGLNITNMLGANASFVVKIENQTTNTAPSSPTAFVAYIVGPSPAGAWSAYSPGDVAMCLVDGSWTRRVPVVGDQVYDKNIGINVRWDGTAWVSAVGTWVGISSIIVTAAAGGTDAGSVGYAYSASTAPTTSNRRLIDAAPVTYQARKAGTKTLRFTYSADFQTAVGVSAFSWDLSWGLFREPGTTAIAWGKLPGYNPNTQNIAARTTITCMVDVPDTSDYAYTIALLGSESSGTAANGTIVGSVRRREFYCEERA